MKRLGFKTEAELVAVMRDWLTAQGWTVYLEVAPWGSGASRADIVAVDGPIVAVVECKLSLNLALIEQCEGWLGRAHQVYAAVPNAHRSDYGQELLTERGIGLFEAYPYTDPATADYASARARTFAKADVAKIKACLSEMQRATEPGARHSYDTPFQQTCERLRTYVCNRGGRVRVSEVMSALNHHYSTKASGRGALIRHAERGIIKGVSVAREGDVAYFVTGAR